MTYQKPNQTHDDDNADANEASSLLLPVAGGAGGGVPTIKKKNGGPMRAMIATCCLLGTLAVIYGGRGSSRSGGLSAALFLGHNQAAPVVYDPSQDFCFADNDNADKYCWYPTDNFPVGNWAGVTCAGGHGCAQCGPQCTSVYPAGKTSGKGIRAPSII